MSDKKRLEFEKLEVGQTIERNFIFTDAAVTLYSDLVGDNSAIHMDENFARIRGFQTRVVHGMFVQSMFSGLLGSGLPGENSVINSLSIKFHCPVMVGDSVNFKVSIGSLIPSVKAVSLDLSALIENKIHVSGKAICSFPTGPHV